MTKNLLAISCNGMALDADAIKECSDMERPMPDDLSPFLGRFIWVRLDGQIRLLKSDPIGLNKGGL